MSLDQSRYDERLFKLPLFRQLVDGISWGICILDQTGQPIEFNDSWNKLAEEFPEIAEIGRSAQTVNQGDAAADDDDVPRSVLKRFHAALQLLIERQKTSTFVEFVMERTPDKKFLRCDLETVENEGGNYFVISLFDITDRIAATTRLANVTRQIGIAEMATGVLHNVGNVLNSVNISTRIIQRKIEQSSIGSFVKLSSIIDDNLNDFGSFITNDKRGKVFPQYIKRLAESLSEEQADLSNEIATLSKNIDHIKEIVNVQQSYARLSGFTQEVDLEMIVEDALAAVNGSIVSHKIELVKKIESVPSIESDKHQLLQILVNLLTNAKDALSGHDVEYPQIEIQARQQADSVVVSVSDNGIGIDPQNLDKIFQLGFTTKKSGHGFGLHSCAESAKQLGGELTATSDGRGCGASFRLSLPARLEVLRRSATANKTIEDDEPDPQPVGSES